LIIFCCGLNPKFLLRFALISRVTGDRTTPLNTNDAHDLLIMNLHAMEGPIEKKFKIFAYNSKIRGYGLVPKT
jgi:hypothetical protein